MAGKQYEPSFEDAETFINGSMQERAQLLKENMQPQDFYKISYPTNQGATRMQAYVDGLQRAGLDVGKGDAEFGYRMPLPEKGQTMRDLIIFRRRLPEGKNGDIFDIFI